MGRPKGSKNKSPTAILPVGERRKPREVFYCTRCLNEYQKQTGNFSKVQSPLYAANNGFIPLCNTCLLEIYAHYLEVLGNEADAVRRICMKYDTYFSLDALKIAKKKDGVKSRLILSYFGKIGLSQFSGKTYDTTIDEESAENMQDYEDLGVDIPKDITVSQRAKEQWGLSFKPEEYNDLDSNYKMLMGQIEDPSPVQQKLIMDLCKIQVIQNRALMTSESDTYEKYTKLYQTTMAQADLKIKPKKADSEIDPVGVMIEKIEKYAPCEYYAEKELYQDYSKTGEYDKRFIERPLKNLLTGSKDRDEEYSVGDSNAGA